MKCKSVHFGYIVGILAAIIIALLTIRLADNVSVSNLLTFAMTLSSMVLALLAIILSLTSNSKMTSDIQDLNIASKDLGDASEGIKKGSDVLNEVARSIENKMGHVHEAMCEIDKHLIESKLLESSTEAEGEDELAEIETVAEKLLEELVANSSDVTLMMFFMFSELGAIKRNHLEVCITKYLGERHYDYCYGVLMTLRSISLIDRKEGNAITIEEFVLNKVEKEFESRLKYLKEKGDPNSQIRMEYLNKVYYSLMTRDIKNASDLDDNPIPPQSGMI
ncbi:hypothetical protein KAU32_08585 [bacterium]|nr:hypothetical protein [bacterium]